MVGYGTGPENIPYHRFGSGSESLFIFPGLMDALGWNTPRRLTGDLLARYYFRSFQGYEVWVASRPPRLDPGESAREMAKRYVPFLENRDGGHVLGLTLGGAIGSHLAAEYPELVDRLVLVACGTTLGPRGREIVKHWRELSEDENWTDLHVDYARTMYGGTYSDVYPVLYRLFGPVLPRPEQARDVQLSCDALLGYDGASILEGVESPALVIGDTDGPLFPESVQRDAAGRLDDGHVATIEGSHAVYEQSRRAFGNVVTRFLAGQHTR